jgi:adenosylmethionine-8-amino-7-oxononanoate aminotransferase
VTSGYLPLGGVVVSPRVAEPFWTEPGRPFSHGATYSGHPTCCAAALANIALLERDGLVERALVLEGPFHAALRALESHRLVREVRGGIGVMAAVALDPEHVGDLGAAATRLWAHARRAGLLTRWLWDGIALAPPLTIEDGHVEEIVVALGTALDRCQAEA